MILDTRTLPQADVYRLLTHAVVPRPIAWVLSENDSGSFNLAPYSYFNIITSDPALLMFSVGHKRDGSKKDTWHNIEARERFVIHPATAGVISAVNESARPLPAGESELERLGLDLVYDDALGLPRVAACPVAFACTRHEIHLVGNGPQAVIYAEVTAAYVSDEMVADDSILPLVDRLQPLARLGGDDYGLLGEVQNLARPV